jgi:hypothetical protein
MCHWWLAWCGLFVVLLHVGMSWLAWCGLFSLFFLAEVVVRIRHRPLQCFFPFCSLFVLVCTRLNMHRSIHRHTSTAFRRLRVNGHLRIGSSITHSFHFTVLGLAYPGHNAAPFLSQPGCRSFCETVSSTNGGSTYAQHMSSTYVQYRCSANAQHRGSAYF